ncbi:MAG: FtsK/SpoIIIE domain-containing protein [Planctomycetota bacterium]
MKDSVVSPILLFDPNRQRRLLDGLVDRVAASRHDLQKLRVESDLASETLEAQLSSQLAEVKSTCVADRATTLRQWDQAQEQAIASYEHATVQTRDALRRMSAKFRRLAAEAEANIDAKVEKRVTAIEHQYASHRDKPKEQLKRDLKQVETILGAGNADLQFARELTIRRLNRYLDLKTPPDVWEEFGETAPKTVRDAVDQIVRLNRRLSRVVVDMQSGLPSKIVDSFYLPAGVAVFIALWAFGALLSRADPLIWWMVAGVPVAGLIGFTMYLILMWPMRRMTRQLHPLSERIRLAAETSASTGKQIATQTSKSFAEDLLRRRDTHLAEARRWREEHLEESLAALKAQQDAEHLELTTRLEQIDEQFRVGFANLQTTMRQRADEVASDITNKLADTDLLVDQSRTQVAQHHRMTMESLTNRLQVGLHRGMNRMLAADDLLHYRFPPWTEMLRSPTEPHPSIDFLPLGNLRLGNRLRRRLDVAIGDVSETEHANPRLATEVSWSGSSDPDGSPAQDVPDDEHRLLRNLKVPETMPLAMHRRRHSGLLIEVPKSRLNEGVAIAHQMLWRLLSAAPPGRAKLTLLDAVGRGQHFASFTALADYDPSIIHHRVWTTGETITQRLGELTQHVEDVLQASLRDRFTRIEDYNEVAGALAEPYHAVAAVGFPEGLSRESRSHLMSLIESGARCGVIVILVIDSDQPWPDDLAPLQSDRLLHVQFGTESSEEKNADSNGHWRCLTGRLGDIEFWPTPPPPPEIRDPLLRRIGKAAADESTITVPLRSLVDESMPPASSADGIDITIGSQGAGRTLSLTLGHGVCQHVLIVGKTGSGKSTLLHSLITAGALRYRPDQLTFYLLDFKKGVEFKIYADHPIPQARVIGIESEREFGLSVLTRLDEELARRGEAFRDAGVGELADYRAARGDDSMPRILLVVDEFQELFTRDDALAADCTARMDRLVRQGRSFGIHIVLSSQSLAGANSLPRATLGQMAVRVALQCGQSDDALILSEDNHAARLLSRPGEAIYNDAGGLIEGNHPFQVAWLDTDDHVDLLDATTQRDRNHADDLGPPIVFEGNRPSRFSIELASAALQQAESGAALAGLLGEAVALGPPSMLSLQPMTGRNILIVAAQPMRLAVLTSLITSVKMYRPNAILQVFDGSRQGDAAGRDQETLRQWIEGVSLDAKIISPRDAESEILSLAEEVDRRTAVADSESSEAFNDAPMMVVVESLDRLRDLRQDDAYQFSLDADDSRRGDQAFQKVLRDGPTVGIFCVVTMASAETLSRWLPRQSHHDLEVRLVGSINASDSSLLLDSVVASELAAATMVHYDEADGRLTKFRLCDPPTSQQVADSLARNA